MKTQVAELVDYMFWNKDNNHIDYTDDIEKISSKDIMDAIDYFLMNLSKQHTVPGNVFNTLQGIASWIKDYNHATAKQRYYALHNISQYWDQRDITKDKWIL